MARTKIKLYLKFTIKYFSRSTYYRLGEINKYIYKCNFAVKNNDAKRKITYKEKEERAQRSRINDKITPIIVLCDGCPIVGDNKKKILWFLKQ